MPLHPILATLTAEQIHLLAAFVTWSRLEALPVTTDLAPGLETQIADPLWMIGRQWQFDELRAEDAGMPVEVTIGGDTNTIQWYRPGVDGPGVDVASLTWPLEPSIEAEAVRTVERNGATEGNDRLRSEAGLQFVRLLTAAGLADHRPAFLAHYAFAAPEQLDGYDSTGLVRRQLLVGRAIDGGVLAAALIVGEAADGTLTLPAEVDVPAADVSAVTEVARTWLGWWRAQVFEPSATPAWNPSRLEYAMALQTQLGDDRVTLVADEYTDGRVDWFTFAARSGPDLAAGAESRPSTTFRHVLMPTPATFAGKAADRYWEFEDGAVFLGSLDAAPVDIARLLLVEYSLAYGNDWFVVPLELDSGSVCRITEFHVRDTFGVVSTVSPTRQLDRASPWTMFNLADEGETSFLADVFFLPPVMPRKIEGAPIEEVALFRDEMANLAWGVERVVAGASGERIHRSAEVRPVSLRQQIPDGMEGGLVDAKIVYRLMTPVPEHWFPLVAVPATDQPGDDFVIELERRSMVRWTEDGPNTAEPRGLLLRQDPASDAKADHLRIAEEEVPRAGAVVTRSFQYGRLPDGSGVMWVGRRKRTGRGEGSSGLTFDSALPPQPD